MQILLDVILPSTGDGIPGASELGLLKFIDGYLNGIVGKEQLSLLQFGVSSLILSAKSQTTTDLSDKRSYWETQAEKYFAANDTEENISAKIKKFNLIGIPFQLILGKKSEGDTFEFKEVGKETQNLKIEEIITQIKKAKSN